MKVYPEELLACQRYQEQHPHYPAFTKPQLEQISKLTTHFYHRVTQHRLLHNFFGLMLIVFLLSSDLLVLGVSGKILSRFLPMFVSALLVSGMHGFLMYSSIIFSMHEGAGHNRIVMGSSGAARVGSWIAGNFCRIFFADPVFYKSKHVFHHSHFGTAEDGAFTNFVLPKRFWISLLPLAGVLSFNDYKIHAGPTYTKSRIISEIAGFAYIILGVSLLIPVFHFWISLFIMAIAAPWVAFTLDRLRESTEHQLMPSDKTNGTRNLGLGFWGLLVGGGPWGQPCHLSHHLAPQLPWYQQLRLARELKKIMTPEQRSFFLVQGPMAYPLLLKKIIVQTHRFSRSA